MEACLSFKNSQGLVACQDMGACGVTCSVFEMAAAGGVGLDVYLDDIPTREEGMTPQEILLSESQERFMFLIEADKVDAALEHFRSYGVQAALCGEVASHDRVKIRFKEELFVDLPAELVADGCPPSDWPVADAIPEQDGWGWVVDERPWWERSSLDQDRNKIHDSLQESFFVTGIGLSYGT